MKNIVKIVLVVLALFPVIVNAEITLTDDVLEQGAKSLTEEIKRAAKEQGNESDAEYSIDKVNKTLSIHSDTSNETVSIYYQINNNNTITFTKPVKYYKGMTYDEYKSANGELILGIMGYMLIANMNNIKVEDAMTYFLMSFLKEGLSSSEGTSISKASFIIVPDDQSTTITDEGVRVIKESEFGQYAIDIVNETFKDIINKRTFKDTGEDLIDSFSFGYTDDLSKIPSLTQKEDELYILSELTINPNADFSKLDGISGRTPDIDIDVPDIEPSDTKDDKEADSKDTGISDSTTEQTKSTGNEETNPKTGLKDNYLVLGISLIVGVIMLAITRKKQIFRKI